MEKAIHAILVLCTKRLIPPRNIVRTKKVRNKKINVSVQSGLENRNSKKLSSPRMALIIATMAKASSFCFIYLILLLAKIADLEYSRTI